MASGVAADSEASSFTPAKLASTAALILVPAILSPLGTYSGQNGSSKVWGFLFPGFLAAASFIWHGLVSAAVPEPYLDEIFHIPQAQKYCEGKFLEWDDKITTPPGLYLLSILLPEAARRSGLVTSYACDAGTLRAANTIALGVLSYVALLCRQQIEANLYCGQYAARLQIRSQYAAHTGLNIALFPLLFFFAGLYYTDVVSTLVVLISFLNHLRRVSQDSASALSDLFTILLGISSLFMRQTNVFWAVVFMGGLEAVHAVKTLKPEHTEQPSSQTLWEQCRIYMWKWSVGEIHDPPLQVAWTDDMLFCILSLAIAAVCNPVRVVRQIWPYLAVLFSFCAFVFWNGGVVLGDKSNHVATIHMAQMLYIWPFFAFFSLPLLVPCALAVLDMLSRASGLTRDQRQGTKTGPGLPNEKRVSKTTKDQKETSTKTRGEPSALLKTVSWLFKSKVIIEPAYLLATLLISCGVVRYNTIIHPFTLADNRHYMFYIFRYSIRRGPWVRYFLILPYTFGRWLVWGTLGGCSGWFIDGETGTSSSSDTNIPSVTYWSHPFCQNPAGSNDPQDIDDSAVPATKAEERKQLQVYAASPLRFSTQSASTSTALIFLLATSLSLITAPLVEPRYFIIPWVMWRILVPAWRIQGDASDGTLIGGLAHYPAVNRVIKMLQRYDLRLMFETVWLIAINVVTGAVFLLRPYVWKAEDGTVLDEGKLQRFMW